MKAFPFLPLAVVLSRAAMSHTAGLPNVVAFSLAQVAPLSLLLLIPNCLPYLLGGARPEPSFLTWAAGGGWPVIPLQRRWMRTKPR